MNAIDCNPLVSIIVPVYKVEEYLHNCVDSIINQTYQNLEIILIDDGSPDNCAQICDEYAERDERIKVIHQKNKGLSGARNTGLDICKGNYIAFVDSDDWVDADFINDMLKYANNETIVQCGHYTHKGKLVTKVCSSKFLSFQNYEIIQNSEDLIQALNSFLKCMVWTKLYPKCVFYNLRFPQGRNFEDLYIYADILKALPGYIVLDKPLYHYTVRSESICRSTTPQNINDHLEAYLKFGTDIQKLFPNCERVKVYTLENCMDVLISIYENKLNVDKCFIENLKDIIKQQYKGIGKHSIKLQVKYSLLFYFPWLYPIFRKIWQSYIYTYIKE